MSTRLRPWATLRYAGAILRTLFRRKITGDLIFLYASFFASFVLPLLTIPFLTRALGKEAWGRLAYVQSFCLLLGVPLAWGFGYHGTRLIARHRDDRAKVGAICSEITVARLLLIVPVGLILLLCLGGIPSLRQDPRLPILGFAAVVMNSLAVGWVLLGLDRMRLSSMLDLVGRLTATLPIFIFVSVPGDAYMVFLFQAVGALISLLLGYRALCRQIPLRLRLTRNPVEVYRESSGMFLYSLAGAIVNQINAFMFGLFAPLQAVGVFAAAEKIIRAACALVGPFSTALHTKINYRIGQDRQGAAKIFVQGTALLLVLAVAGSAILWFASDWIVATVLGSEFRESAPVLRMLAILPVIHWLSYSISLNWFIVQRMDRAVNVCVIVAAVVTVASICILVPLFSVQGITACVLLSEAAFLTALLAGLVHKRQNPLTIAFPHGDKARAETGAR